MGHETVRIRMGLAAVTVFVSVLLSSIAIAPSAHTIRPAVAPTRPENPASTGVNFDYLVIILMENRNLCQIMKDCGGTAAFLTNLANDYSLTRGDHYCNVNPSLPNYLCLTAATDFGCSLYDGGPRSNACTNRAWTSLNIVDRLEAATPALTWKAYMENMPSACYTGADTNYYIQHHNPFVYYQDIVNNLTRCNRIVPAGASDATLLSDLSSTTTASNYMWLSPNNCNNMHSNCGGDEVAAGDTYLWNLVPQILNSAIFTTQRAALFITFDEGYSQPTYATWVGPVVKTSYNSTASYNHTSLLATIEHNWNLAPLTASDAQNASMNEFFSPSTAPRISITSPSYNSVLTSSSVAVTGTAHGSLAVQKVEVSTDGTTWTQASGTTSWTGTVTVKEGAITIYARATDSSGNQKMVRVTVTAHPTAPGNSPLTTALLVGIPVAIVAAAVVVTALLWKRRRKQERSPEGEER